MTSTHTAPRTTQACLLTAVNEYLERHPDMTAESFGYHSIRDCSLVARLRSGKDITTRKLDEILAFIHHNQ